jgi:ABC-type multidrug transport system fused ATPase/permease subunit
LNQKIASLLKAVKLLERKQKLSWLSVLLAQGILSLLDLLGVFLVGLTATLGVRGIQGSAYGARIETVLSTLRMNELTLQGQVFFLASLTLLLFTSKTILSAYLTKRMIRFFCMQGAFISYKLFRNSLHRSNFTENQKNIQESIYAILTGINAITHGIYIQSMQIFTDALLLVILLLGIFLIEPVAALSLLFVFGITSVVLALALGKTAGENGRQATQLSTQCNMHIELSFSSFRDIFARGALEWVIDEYRVKRYELAKRDAKLRFLPLQSKFIMETVMVSSIFLVAGIQFLRFTGSTAIGFLSIFLVATLRISPAILRIQQAYLSLRGALSSSYLTFNLIEESKLENSKNQEKAITLNIKGNRFSDTQGQTAAIKLENLSFHYSNSKNILQNVSFEIPKGSKVLVVGDSGSGKSTLLDLILGILVPSDGSVNLFGENPRSFVLRNPGKISYVTQRFWIPGGKIRDCLNFGFSSIWPDKDLLGALEITKLHEVLPNQSGNLLDVDIGPYGSKLSGGQLQRLSVSRALLGNPKILILDESTNALDVESESEIIDNVYRHLPESTIMTISHRPSFVAKYCNLFLRLDRGRVSKFSSFTLPNIKN